MTARKKAKTPTEPDAHSLGIINEKGKSEIRHLTELQLSPIILNTATVQSFAKSIAGKIDLTEAVDIMREKSDKIIAGDLSDLESTLAAQVVSLNAIFTTLTKRVTWSSKTGHLS